MQVKQGGSEVITITAANATSGEADHISGLLFDEIGINRQLTEIVHQYCKSGSIGVAQQVIDQRRFTAA